MKKTELLMEYFYNERCRIEDEIAVLQENVRYRRISTIDCLELIIAKEKLNAFNEFTTVTKHILNLGFNDDEDKN